MFGTAMQEGRKKVQIRERKQIQQNLKNNVYASGHKGLLTASICGVGLTGREGCWGYCFLCRGCHCKLFALLTEVGTALDS